MSEDEFAAYRAKAIPEYAADKAATGRWSAEEAEEQAAQEYDQLLPDGVHTAGMRMFVAENGDGARVGILWLGVDYPREGAVWIYDIEIDEAHRGTGLGRQLLAAAEQEARRLGAAAIGLQVFGANKLARSLYESAGYEPVSILMRKSLS